MNRLPVWITGVGLCTPCGNDLESVATSLLDGRSAARIVERFDSAEHPSRIATMVDAVSLPTGSTLTDWDRRPITERAALACCINALQSAQLWKHRQVMRI